MPACLPISTSFCVPPAYSEVWEMSGFARRPGADGKPFVIKREQVERAGARITLVSKDLIQPDEPQPGMKSLGTDRRRVYYRMDCTQLRCAFQFLPILEVRSSPQASVPRGTTSDIEVVGASASGLEAALNGIELKLTRQGGIPLSDFVAGAIPLTPGPPNLPPPPAPPKWRDAALHARYDELQKEFRDEVMYVGTIRSQASALVDDLGGSAIGSSAWTAAQPKVRELVEKRAHLGILFRRRRI